MNVHDTESRTAGRLPAFPPQRADGAFARIVLVVGMLATSFAWAQDPVWELRACADPFALPFSGREEPGFENAIADILADELGAELTYDWIAFSPDMVNLHLREGTCDVMLGVPDGHMDLATTIAYYRSPYVFATRSDSPFEIESLDDPVLADLRIGVQNPGVPPHDALIARGHASNVVGPRSAAPNPPDRVLREVAAGDVDVGVIWGPVGGYFADRSEADLRLEAVTPQFDPPFLPMSLSMTMAVRPGDEQLRDLLNRAIAARWDDIQATLAEYGVPLIDEGPPPLGSLDAPTERDATVLAALGPQTTGRRTNAASLYDLAGDAARNGIELGERDAPDLFPEANLVFLYATTPSAEAATRAAERLVATEAVDVLIGGLGDGQAEAIGRVAADHDALFLNSGSLDLGLRQMCLPTTLHVEASAAAYLDVLVRYHADSGIRSWAVVHEATEEGSARAAAARRAVEEHGDGGSVVAVDSVPPMAASYASIFTELRESGAEAILLLLGSADQIAFEGQMNSWGIEATVVGLADPVQQTRDYLTAAMERSFRTTDAVRALAWEHGRDQGQELSERYAARFGQPMESSAYANYQAVLAAAQASEAVQGSDASDLLAYLTDEDTLIAGPKGTGVSFRADDHQLRQPLDLVEVRTDAEWRNTLTAKIGMARFLATVPDVAAGDEEAIERLDAFGGADEGACAAP